MTRELTIDAHVYRRLPPEIRAEAHPWFQEVLGDDLLITHVHFYEGRVVARRYIGRNPNWSGSQHDSPWLFQVEEIPTRKPPPARLLRHLIEMDEPHSEATGGQS